MGPLLSTHPVTRRHFGAVATSIVSLICALLVTLAFLLDWGGAELALIAFAYPLLVTVPAAARMVHTAGRREEFELHEGGLVQVRGGVRRAWTWERIRAFDLKPKGEDLVCTVLFDDGEIVRISATDAENGLELQEALGEHRMDALCRDAAPERRGRAASVLALYTLLGAGGGGLALWSVFQSADEDGRTQFGLAMIMVGGFVTAIFGGVALIAVLLAPAPDRTRWEDVKDDLERQDQDLPGQARPDSPRTDRLRQE